MGRPRPTIRRPGRLPNRIKDPFVRELRWIVEVYWEQCWSSKGFCYENWEQLEAYNKLAEGRRYVRELAGLL